MNKRKLAYFSAITFVLGMLMNFYTITENYTLTKQNQKILSSSVSDHVESPIAIMEPYSNETWQTGTIHLIDWFAPVNFSDSNTWYFNVYLCRNYLQVMNIAMDVKCENHAAFNWTMPLDVPVGDNNYQVEIVNSYNASFYSYGFNFSITAQPPIISISSPNGQIWLTGYSYNISWNSSGYIPFVNIYLYSGGSYDTRIYFGETNNGQFLWTIPSNIATNNAYQIEIVDNNNNSNYAYSAFFEITSAPSITITSPGANETWNEGSSYFIDWSTSKSISYVYIDLYYEGNYLDNIIWGLKNNGSYFWTIPTDLPAGNYSLKVWDDYNVNTYGFSQVFSISNATVNQNTNNSGILGNLNNSVLILSAFFLGIIIIAAVIHNHRKRNRKINKVMPFSVGVKICPKCGSQVKITSRFCTNCGLPIN